MKKLKALLSMDISQAFRQTPRKLRLSRQIKLIQLMSNLYASGFHLGEIVDFLGRSHLAEAVFVEKMRTGLENGCSLAQILADLQFSRQVVTQIALAEEHGNLGGTLLLIEKNLRKVDQVRKKLIQVATYPVILLFFLMIIMLGLKNYLLPQIGDKGESNLAMTLISNLPTLFLAGAAGLTILILCLHFLLKKRSSIANFTSLAKLPLAKNFIKLYTTAYFAREWGVLISQGIELRQILQIMGNTSSRIFSEVGSHLLSKMAAGQEFHKEVAALEIFTNELSLIIEYGEMKAKLGNELAFYSDECWEQFFDRTSRAMQLIQPLIFLFVALMIVLIYAAMLLPIYQNINIQM